MAKQALVILFTVLAFGILVPWYKGFTFLDPRMIAAYGCLALLFVAPASAEPADTNADSGSRGARLGRIALVVAFGWGVTVVTMITALVTLSIVYGSAEIPVQLIGAVLACSLTASTAVAALSAILARRFSARAGKAMLRLAFLLLLLAFAFSARMPEAWQIFLSDHTTRRAITSLAWEASAFFAIAAGALFVPLLRKPAGVTFERSESA
jgi:hypothetical protein